MYIPKYFKNENESEIKDFIRDNGFGILVSQGAKRIVATHIPMILSENEEDSGLILTGHISRGNEQWVSFKNNEEVLAIFSGPHSYISSSWYDHENVPTWNYIAVHVYGDIEIVEGEHLVHDLKALVNKYEKDSENPVKVENMDPEIFQSQLKGIVGFQIRVADIQAVRKLSQNRDVVNYDNIVGQLSKKHNDPNALKIAEEMKKLKK